MEEIEAIRGREFDAETTPTQIETIGASRTRQTIRRRKPKETVSKDGKQIKRQSET